MLPQDISEKGDLLKKCFAGAAGINATNRVDSNTRFSCFPCPTFAGGRSTTLVSYLREKNPLQNSKFFGWSCVRRIYTVLNFYLSDTKRKRRVGFIMLSRKSAQPDVSRKCSLAELHEEVLHQRPEGWIPQIFPLQNPSVALPQYHLLGDQTTAAFDFQVSGAIRLSNSIWPSWPSRCLEVSLPDFFDWFAAHIFIATWLQRVDFRWTPTADSFHFSLGFFCRHWCRHCQSGTTISLCYLRSRPAQ